jgi:NADPH2:quinone reductase
MANSTQAVLVTEHGGLDVLQVGTVEVADPGEGQLLVRTHAAGVNFIDNYQREGVYPIPTPFVLGSEGAGVVEAVGADVSEFAAGDEVAWAGTLGSFAGLVLVAADDAVPVPDNLELPVAAAAMLQGMTADYLVNSTYSVQPGDIVLVHAAAGGVGQLLIQLAKARGARVIGTVSTAEKEAKARSLGADDIINYRDVPDVAAAVRELTGGAGVAVAYDGVGKDTFEASLGSLRPRGLLALFGASSGQVPPFDLQRLNAAGSLYVTRPTLKHYVSSRAELLERAGRVLSSIADGRLQIEIGGRYAFTEARQAYEDLLARRTTGKLLLLP